jgi:geranylgeranyl reductase family protein
MHDVIIAGAGPAGSTCARECARHGLKTLLLDKDLFPRSKPCGGAVSRRALSLLDFSLPEHIIENECFGARVHYRGRSIEVTSKYRLAVLVSRERFDTFLADKAVESEARFMPGEKVVAVQEADDGVTVVCEKATYQSRFLIGADGVHSRVALALRRPLGKHELTLALVSHVPDDNSMRGSRQNKTLDMHFGISPQGYGWLFPHRGYYSLGMMGLASKIEDPKKILSDLSHTLGIDLSSVRGHFIPLGGIKRKVASNRILLVGDAAGFADPFHGEGIVYAILSGKLAAEAIIDSIRDKQAPSSATARYRLETEQHIRKDLLIALRMAKLLDRYPELFLRIFFDHPRALERYMDVLGGEIDYRYFQQWLLARIPWYLLSGFTSKARKIFLTTSRHNGQGSP